MDVAALADAAALAVPAACFHVAGVAELAACPEQVRVLSLKRHPICGKDDDKDGGDGGDSLVHQLLWK